MRKFFQKSVLTPITDLLKQGLTPEKLAMSLSAGAVICCFPVLGTTTIFCAIFAQVFKLNHIAIQISNYVCYPLQLILLFPFFYMGNTVFGYKNIVFNFDDMMMHFQIDPQGFFETYIGVGLRACFVWLLFAPIAGILFYYPLKFLIQKLSKKSVA